MPHMPAGQWRRRTLRFVVVSNCSSAQAPGASAIQPHFSAAISASGRSFRHSKPCCSRTTGWKSRSSRQVEVGRW